jgi:uncharacterized protein YdeI (YjbR/CyaY-like superfamily)
VITFHADSAGTWRDWLAAHCDTEREVWLVIYHAGCGTPSPRYHEAIEQALCFGWIDSHHRKRDADSSVLRFTPRGPRSTWSALNRERATRMIETGLMTARGQAVIDRAKQLGTWDVDSVPLDLRVALTGNAAADYHFSRFPPSSRRLILEWIGAAKKPETRSRRITETVALAAAGLRAAHPGVRVT